MGSANTWLSLDNVSVRFGNRQVLHDLSFQLEPGDFCGLIGPNGAGKSTLLGLFNGLTRYCSGRVIFADEVVTPRSAPKLRLNIAHVFQIMDIDPKIPVSVFDTVLAGTYGKLGLFKKPGEREIKIALDALAQVGLSHLRERPLGHLSGGERQRASIARALAQEPDLLLLDEPTAALDWQAQREILELIRDVQKHQSQERPMTVLMVTHDLNAVSTMVNKVVMLKNGRLIWTGNVTDAMNPDLLERLYDVPITIYEHEQRRVALF